MRGNLVGVPFPSHLMPYPTKIHVKKAIVNAGKARIPKRHTVRELPRPESDPLSTAQGKMQANPKQRKSSFHHHELLNQKWARCR